MPRPDTTPALSLDAMLRLILSSRVYDVCRETPLDPAPRVLITGSLYLAGEVLGANHTPPA